MQDATYKNLWQLGSVCVR